MQWKNSSLNSKFTWGRARKKEAGKWGGGETGIMTKFFH